MKDAYNYFDREGNLSSSEADKEYNLSDSDADREDNRFFRGASRREDNLSGTDADRKDTDFAVVLVTTTIEQKWHDAC